MSRKLYFVCSLAVALVMLALPSLTAAAHALPVWKQINAAPSPTMANVTALQEFKGRLFAATTMNNPSLPATAVYEWVDGKVWKQVSPDGFGNPINNQAVWGMVVFHDYLYAGTGWGYDWANNSGAGIVSQIWRTKNGTKWEPVDTNGFGDPGNNLVDKLTIFQGKIYAATFQYDYTAPDGTIVKPKGVQIYRSSSGDPGTWQKVTTVFDDPQYAYQDPAGFMEFHGMLYLAVESPAELWRSADGKHWEPVTKDGFGSAAPDQTTAAGGLGIYKGQLYWGTSDGLSGQIWRSDDGKNWKNVMKGGFGDANNWKVESLTVYAGDFYAATTNWTTGVEVWKSSDGKHWDPVNQPNFSGTCALDQSTWTGNCNWGTLNDSGTLVFKDHLIVGAWNQAGGQIWRMEGDK